MDEFANASEKAVMKRTPKSLSRQSGDTQAFFDAKELDRMKALVHGSLTTLQGR